MRAGARLMPLLLVLACLASTMMPELAFAQSSPNSTPPAVPHGTCTTDPQFEIQSPAAGQGLISTIITQIQNILNQVTYDMYTSIVGDASFAYALRALLTLYIVFYGILFTFGMVQITMFDFSVRMIKIGIIAMLLSKTPWSFFHDTVIVFFNAGTDSWINAVSASVLGESLPFGGNAPPFYIIETALAKALSAKMAVTLMAMFFTPPYGPIFGLLVSMGISTFIRAVLTAAWVYLMSLILKALLFSIAPIFLSFILFVRTRYLFDGWLNQVVNATLQPVLLFTFLAFFVQLIGVAIENLLQTPVCWTEWSESLRGSPFSVHYWRFTLCSSGGGDGCELYGGAWSFSGPQSGSGPIFPIDILGVLVLVMLADLCSRFNSIVVLIASDLASASTNLATMGGDMASMFKQANGGNRSPDGGNVGTTGGGQGGGGLPNQRNVPGASGGARPVGTNLPTLK